MLLLLRRGIPAVVRGGSLRGSMMAHTYSISRVSASAREPMQYAWFYAYTPIPTHHLDVLRPQLLRDWGDMLGVVGRVYIATEGINAQVAVPTRTRARFLDLLSSNSISMTGSDADGNCNGNGGEERIVLPRVEPRFGPPLPTGHCAFNKLHVRIRPKLVQDGLQFDLDTNNAGVEVGGKEWEEGMQQSSTIVIDARNKFEADVGKFDGAHVLHVHQFRDVFDAVDDLLQNAPEKPKKIMMYCTGGIRCVKLGAWLVQERGWNPQDVLRLEGGINEYANYVQQTKNGESMFRGKNFTFDKRLSNDRTRITDHVIGKCHQCGEPADSYADCGNDLCHVLFLQCTNCAEIFDKTCSVRCKHIKSLPHEERRALGKYLGSNNAWHSFGLPAPHSGPRVESRMQRAQWVPREQQCQRQQMCG